MPKVLDVLPKQSTFASQQLQLPALKSDVSLLDHLQTELQHADVDAATILAFRAECDAFGSNGADATQKEVKLIQVACDVSRDRTFAARAGSTLTAYSTVLDYISKYSKDLRAAIEYTSQFHAVDSPGLGWRLHVTGNSASLELFWKHGDFAGEHRYVEFVMFSALARIRTITQTSFRPIEVLFKHDAQDLQSSFEKLAGCPVVFGAEKMEMLFPVGALDRPIPTYDAKLHAHLTDYAKRLLEERKPDTRTLRSSVEERLLAELPLRLLRSDEMARQLGMSPRTFARRLSDEGLSYKEIVDDIRFDLATALIRDNATFSRIAFALGYSDQASFSTAFKRWTGLSPSTYRKGM